MYRHFPSKDDLARQLFVENYAAIGRELNAVQAQHEATQAKLDAMVRYFCDAFEKDAAKFTYLFLARHRHLQSISARTPNPYLVFRRVIHAGMRHGDIPHKDPDVATSMVMGIVLQVIDSRILGGRIRQSIASLTDHIVRACMHVLYA